MAKSKAKPAPDVRRIARARLEGMGRLLDQVDAEQAEQLVLRILAADRVFVTGKGRSGLIAQCFAMRLMQMGFEVHVPGEATCPRIKLGDLMVAVSCSGNTVTTVQLARIAQDAQARVVAVTAVPGSELAALAEHVLVIPVTGEDVQKAYRYVIGPHNNNLFEEAVLVYFDALLYSLLEREGIPKRTLSQLHTNLE